MTARWQHFAACRDVDPELFFPDEHDQAGIDAAKRVCGRCPVAGACLGDAVATGDPWGVRGGQGAAERLADGLWLDGMPEAVERHGVRGTGCTCRECRAAHARYVAEWRHRAPVTGSGIVVSEQLALPLGAAS